MSNPYNQKSTHSEKSTPLVDYVYPSYPDTLEHPLSFFAFIAYLCLGLMHVLQFTETAHFEGFYFDQVLHTFDAASFVLSLCWLLATLTAIAPIATIVICYLNNRDKEKRTALILTIVHIVGTLLCILLDFMIDGVPNAVSFIRWVWIFILFFLAHYSKSKIYDLKNNGNACLFTTMVLLTISFMFIFLVA